MILVNPRATRHAGAAWAQPGETPFLSWTRRAALCYRRA
jgi:hypothetical protein